MRTEQIESAPDGNRINLLITSLLGDELRPAVYYIHGGGMLTQSCYDANYKALARLIAREGCRVVMVDFRNALAPSSAPEVAPFPAGLNDCVSGLRWVQRNARALGIDPARIVIAGESGGANLAIATLLSAQRTGEPAGVAGLYVLCPYLAGIWEGKPGSSALENAGILMDVRSNFGAMGYGIDAFEARDPLAWPGFATPADLHGLPPTVIAVNECDPLRDDGVDFYRKLLIAGVPAQCHELKGTIHGTEIFFCCPEITRDTTQHLAAFAHQALANQPLAHQPE